MSEPITPQLATRVKEINIPEPVINTFNWLIGEAFDGHRAIVYQKEVVEKLVASGIPRSEIFAKHYLDVEKLYERAGWIVEYDKPAYNEEYDAFFKFTKREI